MTTRNLGTADDEVSQMVQRSVGDQRRQNGLHRPVNYAYV
jgi:hypothetical protein